MGLSSSTLMAALLGLVTAVLLAAAAESHFVWLRSNDTAQTCAITFGEQAGVPGSGAFLDMIANGTRAWGTPATTAQRTELSFSKVAAGGAGNAELIASIPHSVSSAGPYVLEGSLNFGVFNEGPEPAMLKYYFNADRATKPNDWFQIQNLSQLQLDISIRDPYMKMAWQSLSSHHHLLAPRALVCSLLRIIESLVLGSSMGNPTSMWITGQQHLLRSNGRL